MKFYQLLTKFIPSGHGARSDLARKIGVTVNYVTDLAAGRRKAPTLARCQQIASALSLNEEETRSLIDAAMQERQKPEAIDWLSSRATTYRIPVISWVKANRFESISDPFPLGISDEYIETTTKGEAMFALRIKGDCMTPEFNEGEVIVIRPDIAPENGDYVIIKDILADEATFKQLKRHGNKIILHPLNPRYKDIELDGKKQFKIIGKVVEKIKKY